MAVFTQIAAEEISTFLKAYDGIGALEDFSASKGGIENSTYFLSLTSGRYVLTLYEAHRHGQRDPSAFLRLMDVLHQGGLRVPPVMRRRDGALFGQLAERPAALMGFLEGEAYTAPESPNGGKVVDETACGQVGAALAQLHQLAQGVDMPDDPFTPTTLGALYRAHAAEPIPVIEATLATLSSWPPDLPRGAIHGDLFPDNVLFAPNKPPGLIDFSFACRGALAYDLAICLNAWCHDGKTLDTAKHRAMLDAYHAVRPLSEAERQALPLLAQAAGLRFFLTRLEDTQNGRMAKAGIEPKDPAPWLNMVEFWARQCSGGGISAAVEIWTDGACSGNPGPGGWGVVIRAGGEVRHLSGREESTTNNRMELVAAIEALTAIPEGSAARLHTDSTYVRDGITRWIENWKRNGWRAAGRGKVKNRDLWMQLDALAATRKIEWHWVRGHDGDAGNEAADALARAAIWQD